MTPLTRDELKSKTAIVILAFAEYESLELSLATHARFSVDAGVPIFILQNGRGTYDTERTLSVGKRYEKLFPQTIRVIDHIPPQKPYLAIRRLFEEELFGEYAYIIKLDDDVMVLTPDWIDTLIDCYIRSRDRYGEDLAYVTSLVNNNPYGFKQLLARNEALSREYFADLARPHMIGCAPDDSRNPYRLVPKETVYGGGFGTIWQLPYIARWIHEKTTLRPACYVDLTKDFGLAEVDARERYSINCMLFRKELWKEMSNGGTDDELMLHEYCMLNRKRIVADLSLPMVHLAFYSQREELRDTFSQIRDVYTAYLALPFPIAMCGDRMIEVENRLRFMEKNMGRGKKRVRNGDPPWLVRKCRGGIQCYRDHGLRYTVRRFFEHITGRA